MNDLTKINLDTAINTAVEAILKRGTEGKVLSVNVSFTINKFDTDFYAHKDIYLLYYRPNNFTTVCITDEYLRGQKEKEVEFLSCHDSCWREDGTNSAIRKAARELEKIIEDTIRKEKNIGKDGKGNEIDLFDFLGAGMYGEAMRKYHAHVSYGLMGFQLYEGNLEMSEDRKKRKCIYKPIIKTK